MSTTAARTSAALAAAKPVPFWLDTPDAPALRPSLEGDAEVDLLIVGGGLSGLWAAVLAAEEGAGSVMVLEGESLAFGASGRNGGFCEASLTHGIENGIQRWPDEMAALERLGRENLAAIVETIRHYDIDCRLEPSGALSVATEPYQIPALLEEAEMLRRFGWIAEVLDRDAVRAQVSSPTYLGGLWLKDGCVMLDPARLCWGLARAAEGKGAVIYERTPVLSLRDVSDRVVVGTPRSTVRARRVFLATSAFPPLLASIRRYVAPVYDYVLATEPLDARRREAIGWRNRQGIADLGNQFHYYRLTADHRILWGGYDAIYHFGNDMGPHRDQRPQTHERLAAHFFATFPQLADVRFTHRWGGAIDTCSRFCAFFGTALGGRVAYAAGFTGLGVGASRFGAQVALDLLAGRDTERTRLRLVRQKPLPFPPEPLRYLGIELTRRALDRADRHAGKRGLWLRILDRLGLGYAS